MMVTVAFTVLLLLGLGPPCLPADPAQEEAQQQECITTLRGERLCGPARPKQRAPPQNNTNTGAVGWEQRGGALPEGGGVSGASAACFLQDTLQVLSWEARVFQVPHFVSDAEADALKELGHEALSNQYGGRKTLFLLDFVTCLTDSQI